jgi:multisubunit Na+/H+ antiporter MnhC subunit
MRTVDIASGPVTNSPWRAFARHFLEMMVAMVAGMVILGLAVSLLLVRLGCTNQPNEHVGLHAHSRMASNMGCASLLNGHVDPLVLVLATNMIVMTAGMGMWMRYRGYAWIHIAEMGGAMYLPILLLMVLYSANVLGGGFVFIAGHVLMLPAMLGIMLYRWRSTHRTMESIQTS